MRGPRVGSAVSRRSSSPPAGRPSPMAARDGEDPGNVYTIPEGGRVGVTLTAESVDGVDGCTAAECEGFLASCFLTLKLIG